MVFEKFNNTGIKLIFTNQPELSTNKNEALSSLLLAIYGYFAQTEREIISQRTKQGLAAAQASGKILGRPKGVKNKHRALDPFKDNQLTISKKSFLNFAQFDVGLLHISL